MRHRIRPFRRAQRPPGNGSRQPLSHPLGCGFGSNENGEVLRCPFQNGVGRNLVIQDHCTQALWVTLRADERAELQVIDNNSASFKKLKLVERASNYLPRNSKIKFKGGNGISSPPNALHWTGYPCRNNETPSMRWLRRSIAAARSWMRIICSGQRTVWNFRWRI